MKNFTSVALAGIALLQVTAAACIQCPNNDCLKAVVSLGVADCSSNLLVTVTASAR